MQIRVKSRVTKSKYPCLYLGSGQGSNNIKIKKYKKFIDLLNILRQEYKWQNLQNMQP